MAAPKHVSVTSSSPTPKVTSKLTEAEASDARLRVRAKILGILADHDTSESNTKTLRALAAHDVELTCLLYGVQEAKSLMALRTQQAALLMVREPWGQGTQADDFAKLLADAKSSAAAPDPAPQPMTLPPAITFPEPRDLTVPQKPAPTPVQAALLSIVPKVKAQKPSTQAHARARKVLTTYASAVRAPKSPIPERVIEAARLLVEDNAETVVGCAALADVSRQALHRLLRA